MRSLIISLVLMGLAVSAFAAPVQEARVCLQWIRTNQGLVCLRWTDYNGGPTAQHIRDGGVQLTQQRCVTTCLPPSPRAPQQCSTVCY